LGFGVGAVHAADPNSIFANIDAVEIGEIIHPSMMIPQLQADYSFSKIMASEQFRLLPNVIEFIKRLMPKLLIKFFKSIAK
jgi:hypothetical protein